MTAGRLMEAKRAEEMANFKKTKERPHGVELEDAPCNGYVLTLSGQHIYLQDGLTEDQINIKDIAHSLSLQNRFVGHSIRPYSVAEHSLNCVTVAELYHDEDDPNILLGLLLHDAVEAYIGDIARPTKYLFCKELRKVEQKLEEQIFAHFKLPYKDNHFRELLAEVDTRMCATESSMLCAEKMPSNSEVYFFDGTAVGPESKRSWPIGLKAPNWRSGRSWPLGGSKAPLWRAVEHEFLTVFTDLIKARDKALVKKSCGNCKHHSVAYYASCTSFHPCSLLQYEQWEPKA